MFPILAGLGAAVLAAAFFGDEESSVDVKPAQKPKKKKKPSDDVESPAAAHSRATKERDDHWKAEIKTLKSNHKSALGALKDAFATETPPLEENPEDKEE